MIQTRASLNKMHSFKMTVVIPTLGHSPHLRGLLERLQRQTTDFAFEVLVVANIPQQQLRNLVNSIGSQGNGSFEYLETGRLGVNLARNKGLERANAAIVLFLDDDAILENDSFLSKHLQLHNTHQEAVAIGGPYRLTSPHTIWDQAYHDVAHDWLNRHRQSKNQTSQLLGGNLSVKKEILLSKRWRFDEEISFGGAETGLCLRIANAHLLLLFFEELEIGHAPGLTRHAFCRKAFLQGAGAKWRESQIPDMKFQYANELKPSSLYDSKPLRAAQELYHLCFEFGWKSAPYEESRTLPAPPTFNYLGYLVFRLRRLSPLHSFRRRHRRLYASLRSAWINGASFAPNTKKINTEH